jgi:Rps23 Pro-64 3,4-dihydroxylase Tpa1-like proline 4-hydroxylase
METMVFQLDSENLQTIKSIHNRYVNGIGMKYGWTADDTKEYDQSHWNSSILKNSKYFPISHDELPFLQKNPDVLKIWNEIKSKIGDRGLLRVYINGYTYGTDGYAHVDDKDTKDRFGNDFVSETAIVYLNETWDIDYAGETVIFDDDKEIEKSVLPKHGRVLIFDSRKLHAARPVSRIFKGLRTVLVFKTMDKSQLSSPEVDFLKRIVDGRPHSGRTFFEHLYQTSMILETMKLKREVCLAGLFHSIYGTEFYEFSNQEVTRDKIKNLIGEYSESLVYEFCTLRNRLDVLLTNPKNYDYTFWKDLVAIEIANLIEQNKNGSLNDKIKSLEVVYNHLEIKLGSMT